MGDLMAFVFTVIEVKLQQYIIELKLTYPD